MKQILIVFLCVVMVMLVGYAVQKENLAFGPMTVLVDPLPPEPLNATEEPNTRGEPREANADTLRSGGW
jgi:hypothetical protein